MLNKIICLKNIQEVNINIPQENNIENGLNKVYNERTGKK